MNNKSKLIDHARIICSKEEVCGYVDSEEGEVIKDLAKIALDSLAAKDSIQSEEEEICRFVTKIYSRYQGSYLCGKCADITCYLLKMAGKPFQKLSCEVDGVGHLLVRSGNFFIDPSIKQFGDHSEFSVGLYPIEGIEMKSAKTAPDQLRAGERAIMTAEQKQALIEWLKPQIDELQNVSDEIPFGLDSDSAMHLNTMRVALAALTAPPVKLPKGFNPGIGDIFDKAAPVMRRDATDGKWLHKADVTKILNELGYKVQE